MNELDPPILDPALLPAAPHDPYAALRFRDFRLLGIGRFIAVLGEQMIGVAIGWELYERTGSALALGLVGLVQVIPVILLSLPAGHIADRLDRRQISIAAQVALALCALGLALLSATQGALVLIYGCLLLIGAARAFSDPATAALLPQTVPPELFTNAATWESSTWQLAAVLGPALGGLVIAVQRSATLVYILNAVAAICCALMLLAIRSRRAAPPPSEEATLSSLAAGARFVWRTKVLMAAITLDLFAVLLGGATALLPIFARDILQVGAAGLGWLRAAPSIGAVLMAMSLAYLPPIRKAGPTLLWAVAGFGAATIVFGLSRSFGLSLAMLGLLGALDNVSVVIRGTLLLTHTPDEMRGRVSAVNSVFIGASNELGGFESGLAAALLNPITAVVAGGVGTILVVTVVALLWPEMRRLGRLGSLEN
jgi:MFS family permease